ncbi:hypothetical protein JXA88_13985 [Candidatus Fermentibacteria bacterium]|nr:hypothetical protein [Candidatus Fermentibacteria bacterium]
MKRSETARTARATWLALGRAIFAAVALFGTALPRPSIAQDLGWAVETIDWPREFELTTDRCVAIDSQGRAHLIYGGDRLYHSWRDGTGWHDEIVDQSAEVGAYASVTIDQGDHLHVSYFDARNGDLRYAFWDGAQWSIHAVDSAGDVGSATSVALDNQGFPRISYCDVTGDKLKFAALTASGWTIQAVPGSEGAEFYTSLALDADGTPHVAYFDSTAQSLKHAWRIAVEWRVDTVDESDRVGEYCSIALDSQGYPRISYWDWAHRNLKYASWDGSVWVKETVGAEGSSGGATSLVLEEDGTPHISFGASEQHKYATKVGSTWEIVTICWTQDILSHHSTSIGLDPLGAPRIVYSYAYYDGYNFHSMLEYACPDSAGWILEVADSEGLGVGEYCSLAMDPEGNPHVSYCRSLGYERGDLDYAFWDGFSWRYETVAMGHLINQSVGQHSSLAEDGDGRAHVSFWSPPGNLCYSVRDDSGWTTSEIGFAGACDLAVDTMNRPHIISTGLDGSGIFYAHSTELGWEVSLIDQRGQSCPSIALDLAGIPSVVYSYTVSQEGMQRTDALMYAHLTDSGWISGLVDSSGAIDAASLAVDASNQPHVAYSVNGRLEYALKSNGEWTFETVDIPYDDWTMGRYASLALDSNGNPHVGYCRTEVVESWPENHVFHRVRYAQRDESGWRVQDLDELGDYTSLALDGNDAPCICFRSGGTLRLARSTGLGCPVLPAWKAGLQLRLVGPCPSTGMTPFGLFLAEPSPVNVSVFDLGGRRVRIVAASPLPEGTHRLVWDGLDDRGLRVPSGTYVCSAEAGDARASARVVLIR